MAAELRWILLGLSLLLLGGIWWWGTRRGARAAGNAELRESRSAAPEPLASELAAEVTSLPENRGWGVSPFEPLSIRTDDYESVPVLDGPMLVSAHPMEVRPSELDTQPVAVPVPRTVAPPAEKPSIDDREPAAAASAEPPPPPPNVSEQQKIVTVRVSAAGDALWSGVSLLAALEAQGLAFGRYQVFHRRHSDGRSLFCAASLIEPGTFDVVRMAVEEFKGVTLFAVLPGPVEPLLTVDELFTAACGLAEELSGVVQDSKGVLLSPQRAAVLRDDVARFQASLPLA